MAVITIQAAHPSDQIELMGVRRGADAVSFQLVYRINQGPESLDWLSPGDVILIRGCEVDDREAARQLHQPGRLVIANDLDLSAVQLRVKNHGHHSMQIQMGEHAALGGLSVESANGQSQVSLGRQAKFKHFRYERYRSDH